MKMKLTLFVALAYIFCTCSPSTKITASWKNPKADDQTVSSILVTALTEKMNNRQTVETDLGNALQKAGLQTTKSIDVLPPNFTDKDLPDRNELPDKIKDSGVDGILTIALIDKETESRYVPGDYGYTPVTRFAYYGRFWGYYSTWVPTLRSPGYYREDKTYFIETNLYDAQTEELIWSAQSETYNPNSLTDFSEEFSKVVLTKLQDDGVITANKI